MSDIVSYHEHNPDPQFEGCRHLGLVEDGVVFDGVEPFDGIFTYIGRTSIVEAFALLHGISPAYALNMLNSENSKNLRAKIHKLEDEKALLAERLSQINSLLLEDNVNATPEAASESRGSAEQEEPIEESS